MAFFWPTSFAVFIQFVALTTLTSSVILLVGDLIHLVRMPAAVRAGILASFVISVLGSAASVVVQAWSINNNRHASKHQTP
jgi:hypothetical protein